MMITRTYTDRRNIHTGLPQTIYSSHQITHRILVGTDFNEGFCVAFILKLKMLKRCDKLTARLLTENRKLVTDIKR